MKKTNTIITIVVLVLIAIGAYFLFSDNVDDVDVIDLSGDDQEMATDTPATTTDQSETSDETAGDDESARESQTIIGTSVEGRNITAYHFGNGETNLLFVGGIHGGYSWNTSLLSYQLIDYFQSNPDIVPENVSVTVIPALNPDGLADVTNVEGAFNAADVQASDAERVAARFNANDVDLNRNFDCNWSSTATWQNRSVDPGDGAFSEPEAQAMRDYVTANNPEAAVVFYASAGSVYSSNCDGDVLAETEELMNTYADASGYSAAGLFTSYEVNGDMTNWMASLDIPTISVLLSDHTNAETPMNIDGVEAVLEMYTE